MKKLLWLVATTSMFFAACNDSSTKNEITSDDRDSTSMVSNEESKEERNKNIVLETIREVEKGNVDAVFKNVANDAVNYGDGNMAVVKGIDSVKAGFNMWRSSLKDLKSDNLMAFADGDHVLVYAEWSGTFKNDFMGMKSAGKSYKVHDVDIFRLNDEGKITEHRTVQSNSTVMNQIMQKKK